MKKKLFIAGDSTAAQKSGEAKPETGWGEKFSCFLSSEIEVHNYAQNGRSTKSFITEKRLNQIAKEIGPGDFLLIQFGHNDQKIDTPIGTMAYGDYQENLARFVEVARTKNAHPLLLTSVTRRIIYRMADSIRKHLVTTLQQWLLWGRDWPFLLSMSIA